MKESEKYIYCKKLLWFLCIVYSMVFTKNISHGNYALSADSSIIRKARNKQQLVLGFILIEKHAYSFSLLDALFLKLSKCFLILYTSSLYIQHFINTKFWGFYLGRDKTPIEGNAKSLHHKIYQESDGGDPEAGG